MKRYLHIKKSTVFSFIFLFTATFYTSYILAQSSETYYQAGVNLYARYNKTLDPKDFHATKLALNKAIEIDAKNHKALYMLAKVNSPSILDLVYCEGLGLNMDSFRMVEYGKIISLYLDKAIYMCNNNSEYFLARGKCYREMSSGKYFYLDKALKDLSKAIELNPKNAEAYFERGEVYTELGNLEAGVKDYTHAIQLDYKDKLYAYYARGCGKIDLEDYRGALSDFLEMDKDTSSYKPTTYYLVGRCHFHLKNFKLAISSFTKEINSSTETWKAAAYYYRGLSKTQLNDRNGGCMDFSKAGELGYEYAYIIIKKNCK